MFKSIRGTLKQRQEQFSRDNGVLATAQQAVRDFISDRYPDAVSRVAIRYDEERRLLIIQTPSKALAGELTLNSRDIRAELASRNVRVDRVIAR